MYVSATPLDTAGACVSRRGILSTDLKVNARLFALHFNHRNPQVSHEMANKTRKESQEDMESERGK